MSAGFFLTAEDWGLSIRDSREPIFQDFWRISIWYDTPYDDTALVILAVSLEPLFVMESTWLRISFQRKVQVKLVNDSGNREFRALKFYPCSENSEWLRTLEPSPKINSLVVITNTATGLFSDRLFLWHLDLEHQLCLFSTLNLLKSFRVSTAEAWYFLLKIGILDVLDIRKNIFIRRRCIQVV